MDVSNLLIGVSAIATLALAIAAFLSIRENRCIRDKDRDLDFRRRCLGDIRNWALRAIPFFLEDLETGSSHKLELRINDLAPIHAEKAGIVRASSAFNDSFQEVVKETASNLEQYFDLLESFLKNRQQGHKNEPTEEVSLRKTTRQSLVELLESLADLKVKLQL